MPLPKGISPAQATRINRCEEHVGDRPGVNKYAVCRASVMKTKKSKPSAAESKARMKAAVKRRLGRSY